MSGAQDGAGRAVLSIDVEDWFHVENLRPAISRETWDERQLRVERNVDRLLELMDAAGGVRATYFVLGWVAERCLALVRRIADAGHEVASHGFGHELLSALTPEAFRDDLERSRAVLEDLVGEAILGYRAPSFSITEWALPVLRQSGFVYDSSVFAATGHQRYGRIEGVHVGDGVVEVAPGFYEIAVSSIAAGPVGLPWGGGGYFRLLPYPVFLRGVRHVMRRRPYVFYLHPWEIDPGQPRVGGLSATRRFRHYVGLTRCEVRLTSLLRDVQWSTMAELVESTRARFAGAP